ncbi:pyridoxal phosphate-dependent aminotransferase [candidate division KSB1 bacterium]
MAIIPQNIITELVNNYKAFLNGIQFREGEDFYSDNYQIFELSYNENPLGPGKLARDTIIKHAEFGHRYPPLGYSVLINELAQRLKLYPDNMLITAGSVTAIFLAVSQYADPGEKVIFSKSSLPWYRWSTLVNNSIPVPVPLMSDMNHDLDAMLAQVDNKTKIVIISNPHNPTGLYVSESELKSFYEKLPENVLFIVDQAYYEYQSNQEKILSNMINEVPNLMLTRTFSKIHGLAGMRVGYAIANRRIIEGLSAKWLSFMPAIGSISTYAALHALSDQEHIERSVKFNNEVKENIYILAEKYGLDYLKSEANFVAVNIIDSRKKEKIFHDNNMMFTAGYFFGYPEWARISFVKRKEEFYEKLNLVFNKVKGRFHSG